MASRDGEALVCEACGYPREFGSTQCPECGDQRLPIPPQYARWWMQPSLARTVLATAIVWAVLAICIGVATPILIHRRHTQIGSIAAVLAGASSLVFYGAWMFARRELASIRGRRTLTIALVLAVLSVPVGLTLIFGYSGL